MSNLAIDPGGAPQGGKGFSRLLARMKSALKSDSKPKAAVLSTARLNELAAPATTATRAVPAAEDITPPLAVVPASPKSDSSSRLSPDSNSETELSLTQELVDKYTESAGWKKVPTGERVDKKIRMRIHHNCHKCNITYGASAICSNCNHVRCKLCPRYPPKKDSENKAEENIEWDDDATVGGSAFQIPLLGRDKYQLTKQSRTGGQPLVRKKVKQRLRRTCHVCETVFQPDMRTCAQCNHVRCTHCPRHPPPHIHKYKFEVPGDVSPSSESSTNRPPRLILRYRCHSCSNIFKVGEEFCGSCKHKKCVKCKRLRPKKVKSEPDPDLVSKVDAELAAIALGQSQSLAEGQPS